MVQVGEESDVVICVCSKHTTFYIHIPLQYHDTPYTQHTLTSHINLAENTHNRTERTICTHTPFPQYETEYIRTLKLTILRHRGDHLFLYLGPYNEINRTGEMTCHCVMSCDEKEEMSLIVKMFVICYN